MEEHNFVIIPYFAKVNSENVKAKNVVATMQLYQSVAY